MHTQDAYSEFHTLAASRYSCRAYTQRAVSREDILAVIDAARLAPSACNRQPWRFIVVQSEPGLAAVSAAYPREWLKPVGTFIVACGDHSAAWHRTADDKDHTDIDVAIATEHICLAATARGLDTCWICAFDSPALATALGLPDHIEPIAIIPLGYADTQTAAPGKNRKSLDEIVRWE